MKNENICTAPYDCLLCSMYPYYGACKKIKINWQDDEDVKAALRQKEHDEQGIIIDRRNRD